MVPISDLEKDKKSKHNENQPKFVSAVEAAAESVSRKIFDEKFAGIKEELKEQRKMNWGIIVGVVIAFLFTLGMVATEVIISNKQNNKTYLNNLSLQNQYFQELKELKEDIFTGELKIQKEIDNLKAEIIKVGR